jgi:hypothetical protein
MISTSNARPSPTKANAILLVDADRVLTLAVSPEGFETISWRYTKHAQFVGVLNDGELTARNSMKVAR